MSSNVSKNSCPGKVPRTLNNRILQRLKNCSNNGTERLKKVLLQKMIRHPHMDKNTRRQRGLKESRREETRKMMMMVMMMTTMMMTRMNGDGDDDDE